MALDSKTAALEQRSRAREEMLESKNKSRSGKALSRTY